MRTLTLFLIVVLGTLAFPNPMQAQDGVTDLLARINNLRASRGLSGYSLNGTLSAAARSQANWMANSGEVSHTQPDGSTPTSRATAAGYPSTAVSENIYMGTSASVDTAWQWWLNSPIHYAGITNPNYTEVGIGISSGEWGNAYVLVFGNPAGWGSPAAIAGAPVDDGPNAPSSVSNAAALPPPSFVVGLDSVGNIMHEIQPGHTLGQIAFMYGYDWNDLQYIRDINSMTEEEGRQLGVGAVLLIPPHAGTYTPVPGQETPTPVATEPPTVVEAALTDPTVVDEGVIVAPTMTDTITIPTLAAPTAAAGAAPVPTSAVLPEWAVAAATWTPTQSNEQTAPPTPSSTPSAAAQTVAASNNAEWTMATFTPTPEPTAQAVAMSRDVESSDMPPSAIVVQTRTPPWLLAAVAVQTVLLLGAGFEFWRRSRKS